jgi:hypothetical protein
LIWVASLVVTLGISACGQSSLAEDVTLAGELAVTDGMMTTIPSPVIASPVVSPVTTEDPAQPAATAQSAATAPLVSTIDVRTSTPAPHACSFEYFFQPAPGLCPSGEPQISAAAEQPFEQGFMVWLENTNSIYAFSWDGQWQLFEDTFTEGQPENDPSIVPPDGRFQPIRGFGKVWRENPELRRQFGWALSPELAFQSTLQEQEEVDDAVLFLRIFNGQVIALTARDPTGGDWVIAAS